jgi:hypothetical protein
MFNIKNAAREIQLANPVSIIKDMRYDRKIRKSQAKLAETTHVPGFTKIHC